MAFTFAIFSRSLKPDSASAYLSSILPMKGLMNVAAASCNAWWMENILKTDVFAAEQQGLAQKLGKNRLYFLPYLMGERSPHNDVNARGAFIGMRPDTTRGFQL